MNLGFRKRNYLKGLATGSFATVATVVVGLFLVPFVLRYLSREQYAVFALAGEVLMWLGLLELGIAAVLNVKAAQLSGKPDQQRLNGLASTVFFAQCGISLLVLLTGSVITFLFPDFFGLGPELRVDSMILMGLMVVAAAVQIGSHTFSVLLIAHQQIHIDNLIRLGLLVIRTGLTVLLLIGGFGLVSMGVAHLAAVVVSGAFAVLRVFRLLPDLQLKWRLFSLSILKETGGLGIWLSVGGLAGILIMYVDKIVAARVVSLEIVTTLVLTGKLYVLAWMLLQQITNSARPALAQIVGEGNYELALEKYRHIRNLSFSLAAVCALSIWAGNAFFVGWWVGPVNYGGPWLDGFLAANLLIHSWVIPSRAILVAGMAYVPQSSASRLVEGLLNLGLAVVFGKMFGVVGIVAATTVSGVVGTCWFLPVLVSRFFGVRFADLFDRSTMRLAAVATLMVPVAAALRWVGSRTGDFAAAVTAGGGCALVGVALFWVLGLTAGQRLEMRRTLGSVLTRGETRATV